MNRNVFSKIFSAIVEKSSVQLGSLSSSGSEFRTVGPATENEVVKLNEVCLRAVIIIIIYLP